MANENNRNPETERVSVSQTATENKISRRRLLGVAGTAAVMGVLVGSNTGIAARQGTNVLDSVYGNGHENGNGAMNGNATGIRRVVGEAMEEYSQAISEQLTETEERIDVEFTARGQNVRLLGVVGDGVTDDTGAINVALQQYDSLFFPPGVYLVDPLISIRIPSNRTLYFAKEVIFQSKNTNHTNYDIIRMHDVSNISLLGQFTAIGDRAQNQSTRGEWGMGISIRGASDIYVENATITDCWGDGIYIGSTAAQPFCENIRLIDVTCDNNRRQGISLVSGKRITIVRPVLVNTNGTSPGAGIDIEPNAQQEFLECIRIIDAYTSNNVNAGVKIYLGAWSGSSRIADIVVTNHIDDGSNGGFHVGGGSSESFGTIRIVNPVYRNSWFSAIVSRDYGVLNPKVIMEHPIIIDANRGQNLGDTYGSAISVTSTKNPPYSIGNIHIYHMEIRHTKPDQKVYGLALLGFDAGLVENTSIIDPIAVDALQRPDHFFVKASKSLIITDRYDVLKRQINANMTLSKSTIFKTLWIGEQTTANRTVTLSNDYPLDMELTFDVRTNRSLTINPGTEGVLYTLNTSRGKPVRLSGFGTSLTVKRVALHDWIVVKMIGLIEEL